MECFSLSHIYDVISTCNKSYLLFNLESMFFVCYPSSTVRTSVEPRGRYWLSVSYPNSIIIIYYYIFLYYWITIIEPFEGPDSVHQAVCLKQITANELQRVNIGTQGSMETISILYSDQGFPIVCFPCGYFQKDVRLKKFMWKMPYKYKMRNEAQVIRCSFWYRLLSEFYKLWVQSCNDNYSNEPVVKYNYDLLSDIGI